MQCYSILACCICVRLLPSASICWCTSWYQLQDKEGRSTQLERPNGVSLEVVGVWLSQQRAGFITISLTSVMHAITLTLLRWQVLCLSMNMCSIMHATSSAATGSTTHTALHTGTTPFLALVSSSSLERRTQQPHADGDMH